MTSPAPGYRVTTAWGIPGSWAAGRHTGEDYAAPTGATVVAADDGTVEHVGYGGWGSAYGLHVIIRHGSVKAGYMHLSATSVRPGATVKAGDQIGKVGSTGNSTGPHLHYEERVSPYGYGNDRKPALPTQDNGKDWFDMATEADLRKVVREELERERPAQAKATWDHVTGEAQPARWYLTQVHRIVRRYLGATGDAPETTLLQRIHQDTKK